MEVEEEEDEEELTLTTKEVPLPTMHCRFLLAPQRPSEARISRATRTEGRRPTAPRAPRRRWTREGKGRGRKKSVVVDDVVGAADAKKKKTGSETN